MWIKVYLLFEFFHLFTEVYDYYRKICYLILVINYLVFILFMILNHHFNYNLYIIYLFQDPFQNFLIITSNFLIIIIWFLLIILEFLNNLYDVWIKITFICLIWFNKIIFLLRWNSFCRCYICWLNVLNTYSFFI